MIKTLAKAQQQERVKFRVPRSVQDAIPIRRIWSDGIFLCGNQYSKTWSFTDINYAHCCQVCVTQGQQVQAGQVIAYVGHTGRATGNHLHFEVRENGERVDAMRFYS